MLESQQSPALALWCPRWDSNRHMDAGCRVDKWAERRADREAAAMLVDPMEYAYAEAVYEGNTMGMARELNVLPWVIAAYRERLHDDPTLIMQ